MSPPSSTSVCKLKQLSECNLLQSITFYNIALLLLPVRLKEHINYNLCTFFSRICNIIFLFSYHTFTKTL